jgi:hypothetical protein
MPGLLAELRLVFAVMADPQTAHEPYLSRSRGLLELLDAWHNPEAAQGTDSHLHDAERQHVDAYQLRQARWTGNPTARGPRPARPPRYGASNRSLHPRRHKEGTPHDRRSCTHRHC